MNALVTDPYILAHMGLGTIPSDALALGIAASMRILPPKHGGDMGDPEGHKSTPHYVLPQSDGLVLPHQRRAKLATEGSSAPFSID